MFVETSAKTKNGIVNLFDQLIEAITGDEDGTDGNGTQIQPGQGKLIII